MSHLSPSFTRFSRSFWALPIPAVLVFLAMIASDCSGDDTPAVTPTPPSTATPGTPPAATGTPSSGALPKLALQQVVGGLTRPTFVTHAGDGSGRLFVVEKPGRVRTVRNGVLEPEPFLDITGIVLATGNEQGLLGLAFHPRFAENGRFFVTYTGKDGTNSLAEYGVTGGKGDPSKAKVLFAIPDKYPNHNGGMLAFGRDGYLYVSTGDGGSGGDPDGNGQNRNVLLGKILRLDVNAAQGPYGIPASNPFVGQSGARPEIWAYGLRNPWRFSFDRATGDLWIADVGQNQYEEVNLQPAGSAGGENYGWDVMEASHCYGASTCDQSGKVLPIHEYAHSLGCSITGGYVYRGAAIPALAGAYLYTDYCRGDLIALRQQGGRWQAETLGRAESVSSFGEDEAGEIYVAGDSAGTISRVVAAR